MTARIGRYEFLETPPLGIVQIDYFVSSVFFGFEKIAVAALLVFFLFIRW